MKRLIFKLITMSLILSALVISLFNISDEKSSSKSKVTEFVNNRADTSGNTVYDEGSRFNDHTSGQRRQRCNHAKYRGYAESLAW